MTCSRPRTIRPCTAGVEAATLAVHWSMYPVQTVSTCALSARQQSFTLSDRDRRFCCTIQRSAWSSICRYWLAVAA